MASRLYTVNVYHVFTLKPRKMRIFYRDPHFPLIIIRVLHELQVCRAEPNVFIFLNHTR